MTRADAKNVTDASKPITFALSSWRTQDCHFTRQMRFHPHVRNSCNSASATSATSAKPEKGNTMPTLSRSTTLMQLLSADYEAGVITKQKGYPNSAKAFSTELDRLCVPAARRTQKRNEFVFG